VAVAAIAASLLLTRSREEADTRVEPPGGAPSPQIKLDALRAAGL
jgi:hypothetical protein